MDDPSSLHSLHVRRSAKTSQVILFWVRVLERRLYPSSAWKLSMVCTYLLPFITGNPCIVSCVKRVDPRVSCEPRIPVTPLLPSAAHFQRLWYVAHADNGILPACGGLSRDRCIAMRESSNNCSTWASPAARPANHYHVYARYAILYNCLDAGRDATTISKSAVSCRLAVYPMLSPEHAPPVKGSARHPACAKSMVQWHGVYETGSCGYCNCSRPGRRVSAGQPWCSSLL